MSGQKAAKGRTLLSAPTLEGIRQNSKVATALPPKLLKASGDRAAPLPVAAASSSRSQPTTSGGDAPRAETVKNASKGVIVEPSSAPSGSIQNSTSREGRGKPTGSRKRAREEEEEDSQPLTPSLPGGRRGDSQEEGGSKARADDGSERRGPPQLGGQVATVGEASSSEVLSVHHPHAIIANPVQKKNPVMKHIRNVPWELGDIVPDFVLGRTTCAMFLSVRYHSLHPNYIHSRLKQLGKQYQLRTLLVLVDMKECQKTLQELAKIAILADLTLILAWSYEEAGRYLETYKAFENKPPDMLMERIDSDFSSRVTESLTTVKKVNKTDAATLLSTFKTMEKVITASREELMLCPGLGPQKAQRLFSVFHEPFKKPRLDLQE